MMTVTSKTTMMTYTFHPPFFRTSESAK